MTQTATEQQPPISKWGPGERPLLDVLADLSKPIPPRLLKQRPAKNVQLTYLPWYNAVKLLHYYAPGFSYSTVSVAHVAGLVVVTARITILAAEGSFVYESTGSEDDESSGYGNAVEKAESAALRRAAAKCGLALYLYDK